MHVAFAARVAARSTFEGDAIIGFEREDPVGGVLRDEARELRSAIDQFAREHAHECHAEAHDAVTRYERHWRGCRRFAGTCQSPAVVRLSPAPLTLVPRSRAITRRAASTVTS